MGAVTPRRFSSFLIGLTAALVACSPTVEPTPPGEPDQPPGADAPIVDWVDSSKVVTLDDGWSISACEGDAPILCISRDGNPVGGVEALAYPVDTLDWYDQDASADENLAMLAEEFARVIGADRAQGCGADYRFAPFEAQPFVLANTPGISFGFTGKLADGSPSEMHLQYATIVDNRIVAIAASAYDEGACPGRDELSGFDTATLTEFRPHLERVLHESPLPDLEPTG